jgi:hypothetical protein
MKLVSSGCDIKSTVDLIGNPFEKEEAEQVKHKCRATQLIMIDLEQDRQDRLSNLMIRNKNRFRSSFIDSISFYLSKCRRFISDEFKQRRT